MPEQHETAHHRKRANKENALKHGVYSREIMLPGEHVRDYEVLGADLYEEWVPEGPTEQSLVDRLIGLSWRKKRLERYERSRLQQRVEEIRQKNEVNRHRENLNNLSPEFNSAESVEAVERILARLNPSYADIITGAVPREVSKDAAPWGPAIGKYLSRLKVEGRLEGAAKFIAIVDPDLIEHDMDRSDHMDEAIDRTIKRLMQVKTAKQIFPNMRKNARLEPKLINAPASANEPRAVIVASEPTRSETAVAAMSDMENKALTAEDGVVIEGSGVDKDGPASVSSDLIVKEHSGSLLAKVEIFPKPSQTTVEELHRFSALCNQLLIAKQ